MVFKVLENLFILIRYLIIMYNTDFLAQLDESRRHLFGNRDPMNLDDSFSYSPPRTLVVECFLDTNGEFVPLTDTKTIEGKV